MIPRKLPGALRGRPLSRKKRRPLCYDDWLRPSGRGLTLPNRGRKSRRRPRRPTPPQRDRQPSDYSGKLDRVIQEGRSAAAVVGDKASSVLDSVVHLAKKTPALPTKWAEAFREGAASVRPRAGKAQEDPIPRSTVRQASADRGIGDWMSQVGDSAADVVRGVLTSVKPGKAGEVEKQIRLSEKRIRDLYVEIGGEAADSWSCGGPVETEKVGSLLEEFRKQEDVIQKLRAPGAEIVTAKKAEADWSPPVVEEALSSPPGSQENIHEGVEVLAPNPEEPVEPLGERPEPLRSEGDDLAVVKTIFAVTPEDESLAAPPAPEITVEEEVSAGAVQAGSAEPETGQEKT